MKTKSHMTTKKKNKKKKKEKKKEKMNLEKTLTPKMRMNP